MLALIWLTILVLVVGVVAFFTMPLLGVAILLLAAALATGLEG